MSDHIPSDKLAVAKPSVTSPLMLRRPQAAALCGKGTSTWDRMAAAGLVPAPTKIGGTVLWSAEELREWCAHGCPDRKTWTPIWTAILAARRAAKR